MTLALERPVPASRPNNVIPLRRAAYRPDFIALAREQMAAARAALGQTVEEFAATLGQLLTWNPTPQTVLAWETKATAPGDVLTAAQFVSQATAGDLLRLEVKL